MMRLFTMCLCLRVPAILASHLISSQAGVGCSAGCRCLSCINPHGRRAGEPLHLLLACWICHHFFLWRNMWVYKMLWVLQLP